ncbi:RNA-binding domain-containing protein [uncultured Methanomethylovorans sp.]|uniref:RNA-binding domain-containing protein n=1 Tax=uncultured Methanomethylovorans sp. TaxID=183759 RepID=UPI002AA90D2F|nr:RNA-binding domain-containing protein [uncultured Methanomethylovorans sp.]
MIVHSTEEKSRVIDALGLFLINSCGERAFRSLVDIVNTIEAEGHYGNPITILSAQLTRKRDTMAFAEFVHSNMTSEDIETLRNEMPDRLDEDQVFHLRFDKQEAYMDRVKLISSSDAITAKVKIETYPKDRKAAGKIVEELFG